MAHGKGKGEAGSRHLLTYSYLECALLGVGCFADSICWNVIERGRPGGSGERRRHGGGWVVGKWAKAKGSRRGKVFSANVRGMMCRGRNVGRRRGVSEEGRR